MQRKNSLSPEKIEKLFTQYLGQTCEVYPPSENNPYWSITVGTKYSTQLLEPLDALLEFTEFKDKHEWVRIDNRWYRQLFKHDDPNYELGRASDYPDISIEHHLLEDPAFLKHMQKTVKNIDLH